MSLYGTIPGKTQPSPEQWLDLARAHQGYHTGSIAVQGAARAENAVRLLGNSPVSDHVLDAGWLAVQTAHALPRRSGIRFFDLADSAWRVASTQATNPLDQLQATQGLAFLPAFRKTYLGKEPDLARLDLRLTKLNQTILQLAPMADSRDYSRLLGGSGEIALTTLRNRAGLQSSEPGIALWPTETKVDRSQVRSKNKDVSYGRYPNHELQIQVKFGSTHTEDYADQGTPTISMTDIFEELADDELFLVKKLATTTPEETCSMDLAKRATDAIAEIIGKDLQLT